MSITHETDRERALARRVAELEDAFKAAWQAACPDFQDQHNYGRDEPGTANPTLATIWPAALQSTTSEAPS